MIVLDCQCHTFEDVELALCRVIPGMTRAKAHQHAYCTERQSEPEVNV